MRIIISAYSCRPNEGSEQGAAWNIITRLARNHELWVITRARHRESIERYLKQRPEPSITFIYHDVAALMPFKHLPGGLHVYHYVWQLRLRRHAKSLHDELGFNIAHHLTLGSFRYPSGLRQLGIPLVMGPQGGGEEAPPKFWSGLGSRGFVSELARWASNRWAILDPLVRSTFRSAALILAVSPDTSRRISRIPGVKEIRIMPLIGVEPGLMRRHQPRDPGEPVRLLFVGRLVPWKGTHIALRAFAMAREQVPDLHLTILGQGPDETRVRKLIDDLHLPRVELMDRLPEIDDVFALYGRSDVFVFPSLHESGGMAVLEAMGSSLPVVCLDLGGPAMTVTSECGIAVPALTPRQVVRDMADAIVRLASDGNLRAEMGRAARARVSEYAWDKKVSDLESAMANLAGRSS